MMKEREAMISNLDEARAKAAEMFINFSEILKKEVRDSNGDFIGNVWDISVKSSEVYPKSDELIISLGFFKRVYASVPWTSVSDMKDDIVLSLSKENVKFAPAIKEYEFLLKRDILDQQVVDTFNHKVKRVNDVHLLRIDHELMVAHVDIGLRGLFRRLDLERPISALVRLINGNSDYLKREDLVSWKYVQPVSMNQSSMMMKLSVSEKQILSIPPADLSDIISDLNANQRMALFRALDTKTKAKIFENLEFEEQKAILSQLDKKEAAHIVTHMSADEATDLLEKLPQHTVKNLLTLVESNIAKKLSTLLGYSSDSAGGLMTTEYVAVPETMSVEATIEYIKNQTKEVETVLYIYILDEKNRLKGITTIRKLLFADPKDQVIKTAFPKALYVYLNNSVKEVAHFMDRYKMSAIPVIDENKVMHGVITMDDILSQLIAIAWRKRHPKAKGL